MAIWPPDPSNDWLGYDKWAHGWLHTIIVRAARTLGASVVYAVVGAVVFGILYELLWDGWLVKLFTGKVHGADIKDICWNVLGAVIGAVI